MQVIFAVGDWTVSGGVYLLVGCPPGYALVSSFASVGTGQGVFAQDAQGCVKCDSNEYILNTNSSLYTCQPCPIGATCNGFTLQPKVAGSSWLAKNSTGQYVLISCPPGYELLNTVGGVFSFTAQQCSLCPSSFYCLGAASGALPCPSGSFSPAGSSSNGACAVAVLVQAIIALPIAASAFDDKLQLGFRNALAFTCQVAVNYVTITSISSLSSRRITTNSIQVAGRDWTVLL